MKFSRIDVREGLLRNSSNRVGRRVEEVEIDMSASTSERARDALERGINAANRYDMENSRRALCEASKLAQQDKDGLVEAAALMLLGMQSDGMTNHESQTHYLGKALEALDFEIFALSERFVGEAAPREITGPIMAPRNQMRDLIEANLAQYLLRNDSLLLAETLTNANRHLASGNWQAAKNVARTGAANASAAFGGNHWWVAVMMAREATALLRLQQPESAKELVKRARYILLEWTESDSRGGVFETDLGILSVAENDIAIVS